MYPFIFPSSHLCWSLGTAAPFAIAVASSHGRLDVGMGAPIVWQRQDIGDGNRNNQVSGWIQVREKEGSGRQDLGSDGSGGAG